MILPLVGISTNITHERMPVSVTLQVVSTHVVVSVLSYRVPHDTLGLPATATAITSRIPLTTPLQLTLC